MSRPLLLIAPAIIAGTAVGHLVFYEWNLGSYAAGSIVVMWGGLVLLTLAAWLLHKHAENRHVSWGFVLVTALFFVLAGTLRYAHFTAQRWPAWAEMKARLDRPINRGNPDEFDYEQWLWVQEKQIAADGWTVIDAPRPLDSLRSRALRLRGRLIQRYAEAGLQGDTLALISAMTLADRSHVSTATRTLYAEAGASHLLALSGLHLGIIVGLLTWLFGGFRMRWSRWRLPAIAAIIPLVWGYAFVTGLPPSLVRAALMSTVFFVTMALERDADGVNSLLLTVAVMLLWRPTYLFDVGAQLSVMAVLGICLFYGPVTRWFISTHKAAYLRLKHRHLAAPLQLLLVSFSAQLLTMPLVGHYFHQIAPWGTLFSLFFIPLTTLIIYGSLLLLLIPSVLLGKGIPFFLAGEEMLRSKGGDSNSYKSSDSVNNLRWEELTPDSTALSMSRFYGDLIRLRREKYTRPDSAFRFLTEGEASAEIRDRFILSVTWTLEGREVARAILNPYAEPLTEEMPEGWDAYQIAVRGDHVTPEADAQTGSFPVEPHSLTLILRR